MGRPQGHELSQDAWDDLIRITGKSIPLVAELSKVPTSTIRSLYGGFHKASVPTAHQIADALGVAPGTLFPSMRRPKASKAQAVA